MMKTTLSLPSLAGTLLFAAGSIILMGIITGEVFYPPGYSTALNDISDLGGTRPPNSVVYEPSATIFNVTMIAAGLLIVTATIAVYQTFRRWLMTVFLGLLGVGMLGVGIFPGHVAIYHGLFSLLTFVSGGIAAMVTYQIATAPFRYFGLIYGIIALFFLFAANLIIPTLGSGGTERWVAYPIVLWLIGLGGYLLGCQPSPVSSQTTAHETQDHSDAQLTGQRNGRPAAASKL